MLSINQLDSVTLEASGRPLLLEGEVEVLIQESIEVLNGTVSLRLTTHRMILSDPVHKWAKQIPLQVVKEIYAKPHGWLHKSIHFTLHLNKWDNAQLEFACKNCDRDTIVDSIRQMINARHWDTALMSLTKTNKQKDFNTTKAGISGLIRTQEDKNKEIETTLSQAFADLRALMKNAAEMVALAERIQSSHPASEDNEVRDLMLDMGMVTSPVTKKMAGNLFHSELARQLSDFLKNLLPKSNEIMLLTDVYSLYNRARGTDLISPDDLYQACLLFERLNLPLRLRRFDSGVLAIHSISYDDGYMIKTIQQMIIAKDFPLTPIQFATLKNISLPLSTYFLFKAEEEGILCRDDSYEGLIFYENIFLTYN